MKQTFIKKLNSKENITMKINTKNIKIRLCNSNDVDDIYKIENVVINKFKMKKGIFFLLKKAIKSMIAFNMKIKLTQKCEQSSQWSGLNTSYELALFLYQY